MRIVAVVPMKLNSRRLPQKNIKPFTNGNPLCYYILSTLQKVKAIDDIYVYCSNPCIREFIPNGIKFLKRSKLLDYDNVKINEVLSGFASEVPADIYVMSHATSPFISSDSIGKGLEAVVSEEYDSAFSAKKVQDFLWENGRPINYQLDNIPRTQDLPVLYEETSGFYIYRTDVMSRLNRRIGNRPFIVEVNEIEAIDIDEAEDYIIADAVFNHVINKEDSII